ncbi:copper amine oxidase N-terminal domain-containing protein [Paenibacillus anaericanus]|uniref:Copper amine oxidase N-terminal domain-containing protein n=1 Tax=Paenibacillus anaericanus TaxID=170367 RepID=A0A433Y754_9BACL|nr:copper amine oxidase N-terminal domain-containing protein [Paenibacillus anaericanus]RUT45275.1 copper amine oxidase N-terminal domain-containing protein [Paenibacillus anaericanus]
MKQKKTGIILMVFILIMTMLPTFSSAAAKLSLRVELNGERIIFPDAQPYVDKNNRVQVPVRFVSEALGAKVGWTSKTKTVSIQLEETSVNLVIDKKTYTVTGASKQMDTAALRKSNRTFVPLRFVSEALGANVKWDSQNFTVSITTGDGVTASTGESNSSIIPGSPNFDWDAWEASRSVEGKTEKITTEGFSFYSVYKSGLGVSDDGYKKEDGNTRTLIIILISLGDVGGDNLDEKFKDAEEVLRQKVDGKVVDSIINYVKQKNDREDELEEKVFKDDTYRIVVASGYMAGINIEIWYK